MARKLARSVHFHADGAFHSFAAGDEVPADLERYVTNAEAWEDGQAPDVEKYGDEWMRRHVGGQRAVAVDQPAAVDVARAPFVEQDVDDGEASRPSQNDSKAAWERYARSHGVDPEGMTKAELIDRLG